MNMKFIMGVLLWVMAVINHIFELHSEECTIIVVVGAIILLSTAYDEMKKDKLN